MLTPESHAASGRTRKAMIAATSSGFISVRNWGFACCSIVVATAPGLRHMHLTPRSRPSSATSGRSRHPTCAGACVAPTTTRAPAPTSSRGCGRRDSRRCSAAPSSSRRTSSPVTTPRPCGTYEPGRGVRGRGARRRVDRARRALRSSWRGRRCRPSGCRRQRELGRPAARPRRRARPRALAPQAPRRAAVSRRRRAARHPHGAHGIVVVLAAPAAPGRAAASRDRARSHGRPRVAGDAGGRAGQRALRAGRRGQPEPRTSHARCRRSTAWSPCFSACR